MNFQQAAHNIYSETSRTAFLTWCRNNTNHYETMKRIFVRDNQTNWHEMMSDFMCDKLNDLIQTYPHIWTTSVWAIESRLGITHLNVEYAHTRAIVWRTFLNYLIDNFRRLQLEQRIFTPIPIDEENRESIMKKPDIYLNENQMIDRHMFMRIMESLDDDQIFIAQYIMGFFSLGKRNIIEMPSGPVSRATFYREVDAFKDLLRTFYKD